jgi:ATP-dependent Clp protease ATP-binding subunit ClpC
MTSNIGVRDLKDFGSGIGFATAAKRENEEEAMKSTIQNALKRVFSPEFLNRLDDVIVFNSLQREHIHKIIDITLKKVFDRIIQIGYHVELTEKAKTSWLKRVRSSVWRSPAKPSDYQIPGRSGGRRNTER